MLDRFFHSIEGLVPVKWRWVLGHGGFRRYFANTGWMFFGQFFSLLISFFIGAWLARYLGPENYGRASYVVAFVAIFGFLAQLGVSNILSRDLVKYPEKRDQLLGSSFFILSLGSVLAFFLALGGAYFFEPSLFLRTLIIIYATNFLWSPLGIIANLFQARVEAKKNILISMAASSLSAILKVWLILQGKGIIYLILIYTLESLVIVILSVIVYKKSGFQFRTWRVDKKIIQEIFRGSWFLMFAAAANYVFLRVDQVMIRHFLDETAVGLYAAALKLVEVWYFIPGIICASLLPAIINAKKTDQKRYYGRLKSLFVFLGTMALIIAGAISLVARPIINFLFGSAYTLSIGVLQIYVWASIGLFLTYGFYQYFLTENKLKLIFYYYLILMIVNVILNIVLITLMGLKGAAWATLISYAIGLGLIGVYFRKYLKKMKYEKNIISHH